jgi:hypothetical protein
MWEKFYVVSKKGLQIFRTATFTTNDRFSSAQWTKISSQCLSKLEGNFDQDFREEVIKLKLSKFSKTISKKRVIRTSQRRL